MFNKKISFGRYKKSVWFLVILLGMAGMAFGQSWTKVTAKNNWGDITGYIYAIN